MSFKEKLEKEYQWPSLYTFKFISPREKVLELKSLLVKHDIREKPSRNGNYISLTFDIMARSSDEIISVYQQVHTVGNIIAL